MGYSWQRDEAYRKSAEQRTGWGIAGVWTHLGVAQEGQVDGSSVSMLPISWGFRMSPCFLGPHSVVGVPWEHPVYPQQLPGSGFHSPSIYHSASVGWTEPGAWGKGVSFLPSTPLRYQWGSDPPGAWAGIRT